ncbi:MAG: hypothetical protein NUV59_03230 [Patescibacteria group bacterium]|nr:hypothetical protein [Patescibacteria group bacterium]
MGTPNRLDELRRVLDAAEELDPSQNTAQMGMAVLRACAPYMKYLGGHVTFGEYRNDRELRDGARLIEKHRVCKSTLHPFPEGFDESTRCFPVLARSERHKKRHRKLANIHRQEIVLSASGNIYLWEWRALIRHVDGEDVEYATESGVFQLQGKKLEDWMGTPEITYGLLACLREAIGNYIARTHRRLQAMRQFDDLLGEVHRLQPRRSA